MPGPGQPRGKMGGRLLLLLLALGSTAAADEAQRRAESLRDRMAPIVEDLMGTPFPEAVPVMVVQEEAVTSRWKDALADAELRAGYEARKRLWVRLGLVRDFTTTDRMDPPNLAAFYLDREKRIYVLAGSPVATRPYVLAHELVHAHRHLAGLYEKWPQDWSDAANAFRCLAEGDAEFWGAAACWVEERGTEWGAPESAVRRITAYSEAWHPPARDREWYTFAALQREIYVQGARFAVQVHEHGGREALETALRAPPASTEQILHPEKYLGPERDEPVRFGDADVASALGSGWTHVLSGDLGELFLRVFFSRALGEERGPRVAEGWDGCRFQLYERAGRVPLLLLMTAWDTEHDAVVFAESWCEWAGRRDGRPYDVHTRPGMAGAMRSVRTDAGLVVAARRGTEVVVMDGVASERRVDVLRALWRAPREP